MSHDMAMPYGPYHMVFISHSDYAYICQSLTEYQLRWFHHWKRSGTSTQSTSTVWIGYGRSGNTIYKRFAGTEGCWRGIWWNWTFNGQPIARYRKWMPCSYSSNYINLHRFLSLRNSSHSYNKEFFKLSFEIVHFDLAYNKQKNLKMNLIGRSESRTFLSGIHDSF